MIQEKDFLYRVPVKTAPITTPRGQIRNPEILVDLEGGEFMHGNILDANSTNKLINQSVKDAVDNKLIESGYVTKDLLEAETSARTKGDEDLSSKIKAEQTRAEGKEKEISDKLAIVDGDSNTEGSFRKAIADVIAAAPEDLDTLKEIADKLAGNDDLHTALNQAITEKADASALANEVTRATGAESGLQAAIATKADATALSNYVLTTALNQQVDTLNTAISAKQDAGDYALKTDLPTVPTKTSQLTNDSNFITAADIDFTPYATIEALAAVEQKVTANTAAIANINKSNGIPYDPSVTGSYQIDKAIAVKDSSGNAIFGPSSGITLRNSDTNSLNIGYPGISLKHADYTFALSPGGISQVGSGYKFNVNSGDGIKWSTTNDAIYSKIDQTGLISHIYDNDYTKCNNTDFLDIRNASDHYVTLSPESLVMKSDGSQIALTPDQFLIQKDGTDIIKVNYGVLQYNDIHGNNFIVGQTSNGIFELNMIGHSGSAATFCEDGFYIKGGIGADANGIYRNPGGMTFDYVYNKHENLINVGTFNGSRFIDPEGNLRDGIKKVEQEISAKQNKITPIEVDVAGIGTASIEQLRTIVSNLINALSSSGLITTVETA